jgi:FMN phosphatase YigB (HAD superfamily)
MDRYCKIENHGKTESSKIMQKHVIFDLGNVLINFDFDLFFQAIGKKPNERTLDEANVPILQFERGLLERNIFLQQLQKIYSFSTSLQDFETFWCNVFSENREMIALAKKISEKYPVYIFSNTDELHFPFIWQQFSSLHFFEKNLMLSYEIQAVKPDVEAYQNALKLFSLQPQDCVFIDDRPINIEKANELGMNGWVHKNYQTTKKWLEKQLNL